jgi:bifunctional enzyme CysN/CysC
MSLGAKDLLVADIDAYLQLHDTKTMLRFITCGSVDDGKSTLIGRLLYDSQLVFEDHLLALEADSKKVGTQGGDLDFALLVDGLAAEREQGITIDVAYRFFSTERRKFIVADTPGHEQYTRNMVTGASTADLALILVDARSGVVTQTRRHSFLVSLLGIRSVVLAVNKLDLVGYSEEVFDAVVGDFTAFATELGIEHLVCIPLSALRGDNVTEHSVHTPWFSGPTLIEHLETVEVHASQKDGPFRMPVQWVNRPDHDFRGFSGMVVGGTVRPGDRVRVLPSGRESTVARLVTFDGDLTEAGTGRSITVTLADEVDVSRGDVLAAAASAPAVADQFEATVVWMSEQEMLPGRSYLLKIGARTVGATPAQAKYKIDVNTLEHLIDRLTNATVAAGLLHFALRRADNLHWQAIEINRTAHASLKGQRPCVVWFTGISGAGKSTIANIVERKLHEQGRHTYLLDGDNVRHGLNKDLGFTDADRVENIRRVAEVVGLMVDAGLIVLVSFISPFRAERDMAREMIGDGEFVEVHVDTEVAVAEARDRKGLYGKARRGELTNFTGIDSPYEVPESPEIHIDTRRHTPEEAADTIIDFLVGVVGITR